MRRFREKTLLSPEGSTAFLLLAAAKRSAGGIARPAPGEAPAPVPGSLFSLFYLVEIRHCVVLQIAACSRLRVPLRKRVQCDYGNYMVIYLSNTESRVGAARTLPSPSIGGRGLCRVGEAEPSPTRSWLARSPAASGIGALQLASCWFATGVCRPAGDRGRSERRP
jgi:hypothetical protein